MSDRDDALFAVLRMCRDMGISATVHDVDAAVKIASDNNTDRLSIAIAALVILSEKYSAKVS